MVKLKEALFYKKLKTKGRENIVQCILCPHFCTIKQGERGKCGARENKNGKLYCIVYGKPCSLALDPIEKKPLYHFHPGSMTFTIATVGCNLSCKHCQNWQISQAEIEDAPSEEIPAKKIIKMAREAGSNIISFSYTEPTIFYEYMLDIAKLAKKECMKCVMVTNGFINPEPLKKLLPYIDAFNIDLKSINDKFYKDICGAMVQPILEAIKLVHKSGKHLELTNLIIPSLNDSDKDIKELVRWIIKNLDKNVPLHFSAFYPCYKLTNLRATPPEKVIHAAEAAKGMGMKNVHTGNI